MRQLLKLSLIKTDCCPFFCFMAHNRSLITEEMGVNVFEKIILKKKKKLEGLKFKNMFTH